MAILEVKNLCKNFGNTEVLRGIDFSIEQGEVLAILGSSGSCKTTLLRSLNFLETPEEGQIFLNGSLLFDFGARQRQSEAQIREKRLHFGLVFQSFNLFPQYDVLQNLTLAVKLLSGVKRSQKEEAARIDAMAEELLARVGLSDKRHAYPCELSGGQQQRVAIARALALKPDILCFDEPTSALDPELTGEVLKVIRELKAQQTTMILVTHEMNFARNVADKILFMADGVIEEAGTPAEIFDSPKREKTRNFLAKIYD